MLKFWFHEKVGAVVVEHYADWRALSDCKAFLKLPTEAQLRIADIWISAVAIGEPFEVEGSNGWKAIEILVNSNAPSSALQQLFEELGGFYMGGVDLRA